MREIFEDRKQHQQQLTEIENGRRELEEERQQIEMMKQSIGQQITELKVKSNDLELIIPLARQLQAMKVDVLNFIPWVDLVQKYAATRNIDTTTAAFDIKKNLEAYGELEVIKKRNQKGLRLLVSFG